MIVYGILILWFALLVRAWALGSKNKNGNGKWRSRDEDRMAGAILGGGALAALFLFMTTLISSVSATPEKYNAELIPQLAEDNAYMTYDGDRDYEFGYRDPEGNVVQTWDRKDDTPLIEYNGTPWVEVTHRESPDWAVPFDWMKWKITSYVIHIDAEAVNN